MNKCPVYKYLDNNKTFLSPGNVVWLDEATTARALLGKSQHLVIKKKDSASLASTGKINYFKILFTGRLVKK